MIEVPNNPAELAIPFAEKRFEDTTFYGTNSDISDLISLDDMAEQGGLFGSWFVQAGLAFIIPATFEASENVKITKYDRGVTFEGSFNCYSRVSIGKIIGGSSVRALCMTFGQATIVPDFISVSESDLLHVPVLAATDMVSV